VAGPTGRTDEASVCLNAVSPRALGATDCPHELGFYGVAPRRLSLSGRLAWFNIYAPAPAALAPNTDLPLVLTPVCAGFTMFRE
jgi:hypothetical protein